jgi:hypothetical protein
MYRNDAGIRVLAALVCGAWLSACNDAPTEGPAPGAGTAKQQASKVPGLAPEMVAAVSTGRASSVISVHFALGNAPSVGKSLPVDIAIVPHEPFTSITAHFGANDGLMLTAGDTLGPVTDAALETPIKHRLMLMPGRDGVYMVTASVETQGIGGSTTRIFSIPVIVAGAASAAPAAAPAPADGAPAAPGD